MIQKQGRILFCLLLAKVIAILLLMQSGLLSLAPDEAQYWTWSQALDWGYYSKPPAIAWQIKLTTALFGDNELGVRFGSLLLSIVLSLSLYAMGSFWGAVVMAFCPLGIFLSFAATTDVGSILFLTLAVCALAKGPHYIVAGIFVFLGALYKWNVFLLWPIVLIALLFIPSWRKKTLIYGILISLLAFLPTLYWNATHDFATFKHVFRTVTHESKGGNFFEFLGAQIALLSPLYFLLLIKAFFNRHQQKWLFFCSLMAGGVLLYLGFALFSKMQPNWAAYLYPPAILLLAHYSPPKWLKVGTYVSVVLILTSISIPLLQKHSLLGVSYKLNPFRQNMGWKELLPALKQAGYSGDEFLFSDRYQMTSLVSFYAKKRAYFFNLNGRRKNQFSYWEQMSEKEVGKTGYFVVGENMEQEAIPNVSEQYQKLLAPYFEKVIYEGNYPLFEANGKGVKYALLFKCIGYNGSEPTLLNKY